MWCWNSGCWEFLTLCIENFSTSAMKSKAGGAILPTQAIPEMALVSLISHPGCLHSSQQLSLTVSCPITKEWMVPCRKLLAEHSASFFHYPGRHCSHNCWKEIIFPFTNTETVISFVPTAGWSLLEWQRCPHAWGPLCAKSSVGSGTTITKGEFSFAPVGKGEIRWLCRIRSKLGLRLL